MNLQNDVALDAVIVNISGRGMLIILDVPIAVNTPVRIDYGDNLLLGDICYCIERAGSYRCGVALAHSIVETSLLGRLMDRLAPCFPSVPVRR